jgi:hypothetical protein
MEITSPIPTQYRFNLYLPEKLPDEENINLAYSLFPLPLASNMQALPPKTGPDKGDRK